MSFRNFTVAFEGLVGMDGTINSSEVQQFADFALEIMLPPNPDRALNNSFSPAAANGEAIFNGPITDTVENCNGCHTLDPANGFFGTGGAQSFEGEPQNFKVAHMRNLYHKIGMFGQSTGSSFTGVQIRGFGFLHDGSIDTLDSFLSVAVFSLSSAEEVQTEAFCLEFPTNLAPIVGQQVTLSATNAGVTNPRIDLMIQRASTSFSSLMLGGTVTECDLIVKGSVGGQKRGWVRESGGQFRSDIDDLIADAPLRALTSSEGPLTYTCAPPGSGTRMGINRDQDDFLDGPDNCPGVVNDDQLDIDNDGTGDACDVVIGTDSDADGVLDANDNCTEVTNPSQCDGDGDNYGNHCDADFNNDLIVNGLDVGPMKATFGTTDPTTDLNCDGIVNGLDIGPLKAMSGTAPGPGRLVP